MMGGRGIPGTVPGMHVETKVPLTARPSIYLRVRLRPLGGQERRVPDAVEPCLQGADDAQGQPERALDPCAPHAGPARREEPLICRRA